MNVRASAVSYPEAMDETYSFSAVLWIWAEAKGSWHFVTLPTALSDEIDERVGDAARGFGSVPVEASLGPTTWRTSIFPSKSAAAYVLPVKAAVRSAAAIGEGDEVEVRLRVRV